MSQVQLAEASKPPAPSPVCLALLSRESSRRLSDVPLRPPLFSLPISSRRPPPPPGFSSLCPPTIESLDRTRFKGPQAKENHKETQQWEKCLHNGVDGGGGWGLLVSGRSHLGRSPVLDSGRERAGSLVPTLLPTTPPSPPPSKTSLLMLPCFWPS